MWWNHKQSNNLIFDDRWAFDVHIHKIVSFFLVHKRQKRRRRYDFYINFLLVAIVIPLYTGWGNSCINWEASSFSHKIFTFFSFVFCFFYHRALIQISATVIYWFFRIRLIYRSVFDFVFRSPCCIFLSISIWSSIFTTWFIFSAQSDRISFFFFRYHLIFSALIDYSILGFLIISVVALKKNVPPPSRFELLDCVPSTVKVHHSLGL